MEQKLQRQPDWRDTVSLDTRSTIRKGLFVCGAFVLAFGLWSAVVPLHGAVIGQGKVTSDGQNSLLQHTRGGKIAQVFVRDGQKVKKGQVVMALNLVVEEAEVQRLTERLRLLDAQQARLKVMLQETGSGKEPAMDTVQPPALRGVAGDELALNQALEMEEGLRRHQEEIQSLSDQIESQQADIAGLVERQRGLSRQAELITGQIARQQKLAREGYFPRNRLAEIQRQAADISANLQSTRESVSAAKSELRSLEAKRNATSAAFREEMAQKLSDVRTQAKEIEKQIAAASEYLQQTEIKSPVDGTLVRLINQTIGGVIKAGEVIAEIVPEGAGLLVEARLDPKDVVHVAIGNQAEVVFPAFNRHLVDPIVGKVTYVSADSLLDERQGLNYFLARVNVDPSDIRDASSAVSPGLAAEVFVKTEARSFLSYLMKPVTDSFRRAFREP